MTRVLQLCNSLEMNLESFWLVLGFFGLVNAARFDFTSRAKIDEIEKNIESGEYDINHCNDNGSALHDLLSTYNAIL